MASAMQTEEKTDIQGVEMVELLWSVSKKHGNKQKIKNMYLGRMPNIEIADIWLTLVPNRFRCSEVASINEIIHKNKPTLQALMLIALHLCKTNSECAEEAYDINTYVQLDKDKCLNATKKIPRDLYTDLCAYILE